MAFRAIVTYSTETGRQLVEKLCSKVYHDFPADNAIAVELNMTSFELLRAQTSDIVSVEQDSVWQSQGYLEEHLPLEQNATRRLTELTPYGITMVQAPWVSYGPYPVTVCLVDTGVAYGHPDLSKALLSGTNRYSSATGALLEWYHDTDGHGTVVTGIVNAIAGNNIGVRGVGKIPTYITRGMDNLGMSRESDVLQALDECVAANAKVISLSLGGPGLSTAFKAKLDYLYDTKGILTLAAAGNNGQMQAMYPAAYDKVVGVAAVNQSGTHWHASNWGPWVEISAPGDRIISTCVNAQGQFVYSMYSGTSMSVPHAAGVAALLLSHFPQCTNSQIRFAMAYTAKDVNDGTSLGHAGCDQLTGYGIVQAFYAYQFLSTHSCIGATWGRSSTASGCSVL